MQRKQATHLLTATTRQDQASSSSCGASTGVPAPSSQPASSASAVSCVSGAPRKDVIGEMSGSSGRVALFCRQLWRCSTHRLNASNSGDS